MPTPNEPLKLLFAHRGDAGSGHGQNRELVGWKELRNVACGFPGVELTFVTSFSELSMKEQITLSSSHHLYFGIAGTNMFNGLFLHPEGVAGMVLTCGCGHPNFANLLHSGRPGAIVQFNSQSVVDARLRGQPCCFAGNRTSCGGPTSCALSDGGTMPPKCFYAMLKTMVQLARDPAARRLYARSTLNKILSNGINTVDPATGMMHAFDYRQCGGALPETASVDANSCGAGNSSRKGMTRYSATAVDPGSVWYQQTHEYSTRVEARNTAMKQSAVRHLNAHLNPAARQQALRTQGAASSVPGPAMFALGILAGVTMTALFLRRNN